MAALKNQIRKIYETIQISQQNYETALSETRKFLGEAKLYKNWLLNTRPA